MADIGPDVAAKLTSEPRTAHLATSQDDRPHVAPVWYRYEDGIVEVVTSGRKLADIRANPRVALSVQNAERGVPEWTVTLHGTATIIEDEAIFREANRAINRKYGADEDDWADNTLVRIDVGSASVRTY